MPKDLESRLADITREFVTRLVHEIRNASFAEVAALPDEGGAAASPRAPARGPAPAAKTGGAKAGTRVRRSAEGRAEVGERIVAALADMGKPMGVREIAHAVSLSAEALAAPLKDLRSAGRIRKHGDKRATKYSAS